jgi:hypothetical protein
MTRTSGVKTRREGIVDEYSVREKKGVLEKVVRTGDVLRTSWI